MYLRAVLAAGPFTEGLLPWPTNSIATTLGPVFSMVQGVRGDMASVRCPEAGPRVDRERLTAGETIALDAQLADPEPIAPGGGKGVLFASPCGSGGGSRGVASGSGG